MRPLTPVEEELNDDEVMELERFLASPGLVESSLDVVGLDGFFAAILAGPRLVEPSEWIPWIWDVDRGEVAPDFENPDEAERILGLVMRLYDSVARALTPGAGEFQPLFDEDDSDSASAWCGGFLAGMRFEADAWSARIDEKPKWFAPILGLGFEDEEGPVPRKSQIARWTNAVAPSVSKIHSYWFEQRQVGPEGESVESSPTGSGSSPVRAAGRNEPCPCGSGRKYKRCCGAGAAGAN